MNNFFKIFLLFLTMLFFNSCYLKKSKFKTNYKWQTEIDYYDNGQIKQKKKHKRLRRYSVGTLNKSAGINITKHYNLKGKFISKQIILSEAGGCVAYIIETDTIKNRFPKLYFRKIKYMMGF